MKRRLSTVVGDALTSSLLALPGDLVYRLARRIVDRKRGDNDMNFDRNGEARVIRALLPGSRVVFDVGANHGDWTEYALGINPAAEYHCFEPLPATFAMLSRQRFPASVKSHPFALGAADEERTMYADADVDAISSLHPRTGIDGVDQRPSGTVRITTLDGFCEREGIERVDFAKIDVEGHEVSVLEGARGMLRAGRIGTIQFEYGGAYLDAGRRLRDVWTLLEQSGADYAAYKIMPGGLLPVLRYVQTWETFQYSNWLLVHRDRVAALPPGLILSSGAMN
jgi:FkbM family methyltransferase